MVLIPVFFALCFIEILINRLIDLLIEQYQSQLIIYCNKHRLVLRCKSNRANMNWLSCVDVNDACLCFVRSKPE